MNNLDIAKVFEDIADLLELKGENIFKIRAYQRVARAIENLPVAVENLVAEDRLSEIPGVGEAITKKITELVTTGHLGYYEELKAQFPEGISILLDVAGIGPKTALLLSKELGIKTLDELEAAIGSGKVASLPRMGNKVAENILHHIQVLKRKDQRIPIGQALPVVDGIIAKLSKLSQVTNLIPAGSLRRFRETVGDIDLMGTSDDARLVIKEFTSMPQIEEVLASGTTKASVVVSGKLQVDLRIVEHNSYGSLLQYFTGSKQHNINLRERARRQGLSLSEYGITDINTNKQEKFATEEAFYQRLGLQYIPPEIREGTDEIVIAEQGTLPKLVELTDIKGDLHVHTNWSDGENSIEEIAQAAKKLGYEYLAITDHSGGRAIAHGLDAERLKQQILEINKLNQRITGIKILTGVEVDIRANGDLDIPDKFLQELDIVIAAVHSSLGQSKKQMTERILAAIENPNVDILAHPTCRLFPNRDAVALDIEEIFKAAVRTKTILEINAMPSRLDLRDIHIYRARELGVMLAINTDAHTTEQLRFTRLGVGTARRGWCQATHILNTRRLAELGNYLKKEEHSEGIST
jgi:DNA polymerase (family X)